MIENFKAVNNPLTIIAIFAALAEIAGTVALKMVAPELQATFVWFVMGFPTLLIILFFVTLNFNPKVLYAPSDFKDEANFLSTLGGVKQLSGDLTEVQIQLNAVSAKIVEDLVAQMGTANQAQMKQLSELVDNRIDSVKAQLERTKESAKDVEEQYYRTTLNASEYKILRLFDGNIELTQEEIAKQTNYSHKAINIILRELISLGFIQSRIVLPDNGENYHVYKLSKKVGPFQI